MTAPSLETVRWPRKKWFYAVVAVFAFQIGAILVLSQRERVTMPAPGFGTSIHLAADPSRARQFNEAPDWSDPAAFALPNWRGFSREGWLSFARPEFRLTDWNEPPEWLKLDSTELGNSLHHFMLSNTMPPLLVADKPLPRLARDEIAVGNAPIHIGSELQIEGELTAWSLADPVRLPGWSYPELLTNTVVRVLVDPEGVNVAAVVLSGSGYAEADALAIRTAKRARFQPPKTYGPGRRSPAPASGNLIFKWHTLVSTNAISATVGPSP
jgi:TonB family protein